MKTNNETVVIAAAIHDWLSIYLPDMRSNSRNTLKAYRMIIELYIDYLEKEKGVRPATLTGVCFSRQYVENWILRMKEKRAWSNSTCNHHLACLRTFLKYLVSKDVSFLKYMVETEGIPAMKCPKKGVEEITKEAIKALFAVPDIKTVIGLRDLTFLTLMYSTATRVNEVLSLQISSG
jgi:site-specific recombinase XerD